jgi:hypothetical protein
MNKTVTSIKSASLTNLIISSHIYIRCDRPAQHFHLRPQKGQQGKPDATATNFVASAWKSEWFRNASTGSFSMEVDGLS